jgi:hypothetical protein
MGIAFEKDHVLADVVSPRHRLIRLAELQGNGLVNVRRPMDGLAAAGDGLFDGHVTGQLGKFDVDQVEGLIGDPLIGGGHGGDRIANVAHLLPRQRLLILADGKDAELHRQVIAGEHGQDPGQRARPGGIDIQDAGMRMRAAQDPPIEHPGQSEVIGEFRLPGDLGIGIGLRQRLANDREFFSHVSRLVRPPTRPPRRS